MSFFEWTDDLKVNVTVIDKQHQELIKLINNAHDHIGDGNKDELRVLLSGIIDYIRSHFKTEEVYFKKFGYQEADHHIQEHTDFVYQILEFEHDFVNDKADLTENIFKYLKVWLETHLKETDKRYSSFFNEHGLY